ncbi:lipolytic enzyme, G-D-S-L [Rhodopirellula sallentina SM41]|uniref:Lipolytic enzyme, G-D-S-L n=1 Tax=Rhodopirellula sallentina SM41 TaxID=1263870 RepID=M5U0M8_9BACT|nr:lipolytic enzyme, G-D-S-L [Rhodopirellula sallentina SM41]
MIGLLTSVSLLNGEQPRDLRAATGRSIETETSAVPFADGDRICFLGDSITAGGYYQTIISNYYLTRYPDRQYQFINAGRSGDTAGGALKRLQEDVIDKRPTSVVIMFGMNDVYRHTYVDNPTEDDMRKQKFALDRFRENMTKLVDRLKRDANNPKLVFLTPTPFDQTVILDRENQPGCNDGLARCASIVRNIARANDASLVDLHGPMTEFNLRQQQTDPTYTIVGPDRIHPRDEGRLMMSWLILRAQHVPPIISGVAIDVPNSDTADCTNAVISNISASSSEIQFEMLENALPLPIESRLRQFSSLLPIANDLCQQIVSVRGLDDGKYEIRIDGTTVAEHTNRDLEHGINLALNKLTPMYQQALTVTQLNSKRREAEALACSLLNTRRWMQRHYQIDVDDPEAVQAHYDSFDDKRQYNASMAKRYIEHWPRYAEILEEVKTYQAEIEKHRAPTTHLFQITRIP